MNVKFKRSIIGYKPAKVYQMIEAIKSEHENKLQDLNNRLSAYEADINELKLKIQNKKDMLNKRKDLENEIGSILVKAYITSTKKVLLSVKENEKNENIKKLLISKYRQEQISLNLTLKNLAEELKQRISNYKEKLDLEDSVLEEGETNGNRIDRIKHKTS